MKWPRKLAAAPKMAGSGPTNHYAKIDTLTPCHLTIFPRIGLYLKPKGLYAYHRSALRLKRPSPKILAPLKLLRTV